MQAANEKLIPNWGFRELSSPWAGLTKFVVPSILNYTPCTMHKHAVAKKLNSRLRIAQVVNSLLRY